MEAKPLFEDSRWWLRVPGKALLAGGYAIIFQDQPGLSLALDAFYFVTVRRMLGSSTRQTRFEVLNPQFPNSDFRVVVNDKNGVQMQPQENKFVRAAISIFLQFCKLEDISDLPDFEITILQTPNFFVQSKDSRLFQIKSPLLQKFSFLEYSSPLLQTAKNGFGSSACLLVALLCGLLYSLDPGFLQQRTLIYVLSLLANFEAQKKIGSGFDIGWAKKGLTGSHVRVGIQHFPESATRTLAEHSLSIHAGKFQVPHSERNWQF